MKIYVTQGTHWSVPGQPAFAAADLGTANRKALDLVNLLRTDVGLTPLPFSGSGEDWGKALAEAQRARIAAIGDEAVLASETKFFDGDEADALASSAGANVWITEMELQGVDGEPMAEPLPLATMQLYRSLADQVLTVVEDWRESGSWIDQEGYDALRVIVEAIEAADPSGEPGATAPISITSLRAIGAELVTTLADVIKVHVYGDDDPIPADCSLVDLVRRACSEFGVEPIEFPTVSVWNYTATFQKGLPNNGPGRLETQVMARDHDGAIAKGYSDVLLLYPNARMVQGDAVLVARGSDA